MSPEVVLYTRPGCHLCDQARAGLESLLDEGWRFAFTEVDIGRDPKLHATYLERIPVVEVDGDLVSELWFDPDAFTARLDTVPAMGSRRSKRGE